ncbi:MAG: GDP-mannose 4,6-dehydratase [Clostridiales bacterium]|jgi:GDP-4-dehydro-6-deoxy-D-mannose reductase|nr:GDP-mannose 4,6-dehydratase [Clostridiales bacterium]
MKALIIGAAGFVGRYLIAELERSGYDIAGTKLPFEALKIAGQDRNATDVIDLDILNEQAIIDVLNAVNPDKIFHLAAQSSSAIAWKMPQLTVDVNIKGSLNLVEALRKVNYKGKVILVGSSEEYGKQDKMPIREDAPVNPDNVYAITRSTQNRFGALYAKAYGLDIVMTRSFNHIGVGHAETFAIPSFARQVAEIAKGKREPILYVGNLSAKRDYIDVRDVCRAYAALAEKGVSGETYNVGSGHAVALQDIVDTLIRFSGKAIDIKVDVEKLRPIDIDEFCADISKIKAIGWTPTIALTQSLKEVYEYCTTK